MARSATARIGRPQARSGAAADVRPSLAVTALADGTPEIVVYGYIGEDYDWWSGEELGNTAQGLLDEIKALGAPPAVRVRINSLGGDAWTGSAIYSLLRQMSASGTKVTAIVDGIAASAASVIAMAADDLQMPGNALLMLHNPSTYAYGEVTDLERAIASLNATKTAMISAYRRKNPGMDEAAIAAVLDAETWYNGAEAKAAGFCDTVLDEVKIAARAIPSKISFKNAPPAAQALIEAAQAPAAPVAPEPDAAPRDPAPEDVAEDAGEGAGDEAAAAGAPESVPPAPPAVPLDAAAVEAIVATVLARVAPPAPPAPEPAPAPAADAGEDARLAAIRDVAETFGVTAGFEALRKILSGDKLAEAVGALAANAAPRIDAATGAPAEPAAPARRERSPEETQRKVAEEYAAANEWPIRRATKPAKE